MEAECKALTRILWYPWKGQKFPNPSSSNSRDLSAFIFVSQRKTSFAIHKFVLFPYRFDNWDEFVSTLALCSLVHRIWLKRAPPSEIYRSAFPQTRKHYIFVIAKLTGGGIIWISTWILWSVALLLKWVFHDTHFCQIIWQIWSYTEQNKFRQKLPSVGFELTTSRSSVPCFANCAREESVGNLWSELSFLSCITSSVVFLESIERDFIKALMIHKDKKIVTVSTVGRAWDWWSGGCEFKPH